MIGARVQKSWLRPLPKEISWWKKLKSAAILVEKVEYLGSINWKENAEYFCKGNMEGAIKFLRKC